MDKLWKQILVAMTIGMVVPQMIFAVSDRIGRTSDPVILEATESTGQTVQTTLAEVDTITEIGVMYIPVVDDDDVTVMKLEDYIRGVVLAEMPASFETEALKAQAVAARTYTLRRLTQGDKHPQGAVCTDSACCQAYLSDGDYLEKRGTQKDLEKVAAAVAATAGEILTYEGSLIEATYFACSGGRTEDAAAVWGSDIPYLQAVDSPNETNAEQYEQQIYFAKAKFAKLLGRNLTGEPGSWLGKVTWTDGGGVSTMVIGGITYSGTQLRKLLGLNSTVFTMTSDDKGIIVQTRGWGHRVGMSQYGADAMAVAGSTYTQILAHYYQGTEIDKLSNLG